MKSILAVALAVAMTVAAGCSAPKPKAGQAPASPAIQMPASPADGQPPQCDVNHNHDLRLAGIQLRTPSEPLLARLGTPVKSETYPKYGSSRHEYPFGAIGVFGDGSIATVELWADSPLGEPWPGVQIGASRNHVLSVLSQQGLCTSNPTERDVVYMDVSNGQRLSFSFSDEGRLLRAAVGDEN